MQVFRAMKGQQVWIRRVEHLVLRLVSLAFSLASAHAIRLSMGWMCCNRLSPG